jgi:transposase
MRTVPARATERVFEEITHAKTRFHVPADAPVISCYEAGREGFWLHRWLVAQGVSNHVIDSSSIEVNRRARRPKTDRLDLYGRVTLLARHIHGDQRVWRLVRVPSVAEEDARHLHRSRETIQQDRTRLINRLKTLLLTQGLALAVDASFPTALDTARLWDGTAIPAGLKARVDRTWSHLTFLNDELEQLDAEREAIAVDPETPLGRYVHALPTLRGVGPVGTWTLATELFAWRQIQNRRQLGGLVGCKVNRLKTIKRQMYGRAGVELLRARLIPLSVEPILLQRE